MPTAVDYRTLPFSISTIGDSGKYLGRSAYWRLYVIENLVRILVHSVLTAQIGPTWWTNAVDPKTSQKIQAVKEDYSKQPQHSSPGAHNIYYLFLPDLLKIILANSHLFRPLIPDIDQWVVRIESVRLPRNIVGHMNWLNTPDEQLIDALYSDLRTLIRKLSRSGMPISIP
jgi:hypothetical protein